MAVKARSDITLSRVDDGKDGQMIYATSSSAEAEAAKIATVSSGTLELVPGVTLSVKFDYANAAASPTLNVNGTGAKAIYTQGVQYAYWQAGATVAFVYDGTNWRVASEPVYANTVTVGNVSGRNIYMDSDSVDIRSGTTELATFAADKIELGKNSVSSEIDLCNGAGYIVGSKGETGLNITIGTPGGPNDEGLYNGGMSLDMAKYGYIRATNNLSIHGDNALNLYGGSIFMNGDIYVEDDSGTLVALKQYLRDLLYPIGSIKMTTTNTNPSTYLGGTWTAWGSGKVPVGVNTSDTDFATSEQTGGEKTHTLSVNEIPAHSHRFTGVNDSTTVTAQYGNYPVRIYQDKKSNWNGNASWDTGGGGAHNNLQPYITCYMWIRTA